MLLFLFSCVKNGSDNEIDKRVSNILSNMTLEEKVGQMTQINLTVIAKGPNKWVSSFPLEIDHKKAKKALVDYKVGSVLNTINNTAQKPVVDLCLQLPSCLILIFTMLLVRLLVIMTTTYIISGGARRIMVLRLFIRRRKMMMAMR